MSLNQALSRRAAQKLADERFAEFEHDKAQLGGKPSALSYFNRRSDREMKKKYAEMLREVDALRTPEDRASGVPVMNMGPYELNKESFSYVFVDSLPKNGFALIEGHDLKPEIADAAFRETRAFFTQDPGYFNSFVVPGSGGQRGVIAYGTEVHSEASNRNGDMKYSFSFGPGRGLTEAERERFGIPQNIWPGKPEGFREALLAYDVALDVTGTKIQRMLGTGLGVGAHFIEEKMEFGDHNTRLHLYPALQGLPDTGGAGIAEHTDRCFFTLLRSNDEKPENPQAGRLIVKPNPDDPSTWLRPDMSSGRLVLNMGKAFDRATRGYFPATVHGVDNSPDPFKWRNSGPKFYWVAYAEPVFEIECPLPKNPSPKQVARTAKLIREFPLGKATFGDLRKGMSMAMM